jgi:hypothetical protein
MMRELSEQLFASGAIYVLLGCAAPLLLLVGWMLKRHVNKPEFIAKDIAPKSNSQGHDLFESKLYEIKRRRGSRTKMDFATTANGTYKDPRTQEAYSRFNAAPSHERSSDNFLLFLMVVYATNSSIVGYAAGGSLWGGILGAGMHHKEKSESDSYPTGYDFGHKETPSSFFSSSPSDSADSCRRSDYSYSSRSSDSTSSSSSSYSSSDSGSSSSDSGSSSSSSSD